MISPLLKKFGRAALALNLVAITFCGANTAFADAEADLLIAYDSSYSSSVGGEDNAQVITANAIAGCNDINDRSGTGARLRICGYHQAAQNLYQTTSKGGFVGWMAGYDSHMTDVVDAGNARGADMVTWVCVSTSDGAAAVAQQPGRYSAFDPAYFWGPVVAHELAGHNYGCDHSGGKGDLPSAYPKSVMMHNYCNGGGSSPPYLYSNPNIWLGGVRMQGVGSTCLGGAVDNGDNAYLKSTTAQGVADSYARVITAPNLGNVVRRWSFNQAATNAPAGTTVTDSITGTELATVQGSGATFSGAGLQLPGGAPGSGAAYLQLPGGVLSAYANVTIEIWARTISAQNWARMLDFNNGTANYIMLTACNGTDLNSQRFDSANGGTFVTLDSGLVTAPGVLHHYAITYTSTGAGSGRWTWYRDGDQVAYLDVAYALSSLQDVNNWLGRSAYSSDSFANCEYQEVRISSVALSRDEIFANYTLGPNRVASTVTLTADDPLGSASFAAAGNWSDGLAPSSGKTYETYRFRLRTPADGTSRTFAGQTLTVDGGGITWKGTSSSSLTINNLTLAGDCELVQAGSGTWTLAGNLAVNTDGAMLRAANGPINLTANLSGSGDLLHVNNTVTLSGNNSAYTGKTVVGDGRFSSISIDSEARLGANPTNFTADQLTLNRGILYCNGNLTISNANRGIRVGPSAALFNVASGTTLTLAVPLSSSSSGDALVTTPLYPNPVAGMLIKDNTGTLVLTHPNNSHCGEVVINSGTFTVSGAGRLNNGDQAMPVVNNATMTFNTTASQTISGVISGTGSLLKGSSGTLTLTGANTMSGAVTVNAGTLYANPGNAANNRAFSYVSGITVNNGATLQSGGNGLFGWDGTQEHPVTVNAGGTLTCDSGADVGVGAVTLAGGTLANLGASTAYGSWRFDNAGDALAVTADSTVSAVNVKFANGGAINVSAGKTLNFAGTITDATSGGTSSVVIGSGTGTVLFTGAQTYTGSTTITGGRVILTNTVSLASSNIITGVGTTFDVAGLSSIFTLGSAKALSGSGTNHGSVTTVSGAMIFGGTDGGYGTNTFDQNLTLVSGAAVYLDLGTSASGVNDKLVVLGNLNLTNTAFHLKAPVSSNLDPANDYTLATVAGTLSGTVNATPVWDAPPGNYGAFAVMVTNANQIVLHAIAQPPSFTAASANPGTVGHNQTIVLSAAASQGLYAVTNVTANTTNLGGPVALTLISDGAGNYTNSTAATSATAFGVRNIAITVTDAGNISSVTNVSVTIIATNRTWSGGSPSDNNWSSSPNWSTSAAPGFNGDSIVFAGTSRLTPNLETNYSVTGLTFDNTAGSFNLVAAAGRYLTLTGSGVTNNSTANETVNVPLTMSAAQTLNAAGGNLTFSQNITNGGNLLTVTGNSNTLASAAISGPGALVKTGTGKLTLSGNNSYTNTTTVSAGTVDISGVVGGGDKTIAGGSGKAVVNLSGTFTNGNLVVAAVSGAVGAIYQTAGSFSSAGGFTFLGHLPGAYGYARVDGGTFSVPANDLQIGTWGSSGGAGGNGLLEVGGGTVLDSGWLILGRGTSPQTNALNVFGGAVSYAGGGLANCWGTNQMAIVNVLGGIVSNSAAVGINLNQSGSANNSAILNLNGGIAQALNLRGPAARLNFNGGTLRASAANSPFVVGLGASVLYSNGATIDNNGFAITVAQPLLAPTGNGVNGIASFTSGSGYIAPPIVTVNRGGGDTTGVGATAIAQIDRSAGTVTNIVITCPGVNYTTTPTFTLTGGGATTAATITGQSPTANTSGGLTSVGSGSLTLGGPNTYTGNTVVSAGTLRFDAPLVHITFDRVSGTTVVNQGAGGAAYNGTLVGSAAVVGGGRFGNAMTNFGTTVANACIISNKVTALDCNVGGASWTYALWLKTSVGGARYGYQGDGTWSSGAQTTFYLNANGTGSGGTHAGGVRWADSWLTGTANVNDGNWHFIAITVNNGTKTIYVDGAVDGQTGTTGWAAAGSGSASQFWIGGSPDTGDGTANLVGLIDEVYIYDRAIALAEVQALYGSNKLAPLLAAPTSLSVASGATADLTGVPETVAALSGSGRVTNSIGETATLTISNTSGSATFSGQISDTSSTNALSLVKAGASTVILTGANTYRGTTTVQGGSLLINGSVSTGAVTVASSGTLGGNGSLSGATTVQSGGTISPGTSIGALTISNTVTLQSGSTTFLEISKSPLTNDQLRVTGALTYGGTLTVTNLAGTLAASDSFQLFSAGSSSSAFTATNLPSLNAGLAWNFNPTNGTLSVVQAVATNPTNISFALNGGSFTVSWPSDHIGWRLQTQTNSLGTNWFDVPNSTMTNFIALPVSSEAPISVFYRLIYP